MLLTRNCSCSELVGAVYDYHCTVQQSYVLDVPGYTCTSMHRLGYVLTRGITVCARQLFEGRQFKYHLESELGTQMITV